MRLTSTFRVGGYGRGVPRSVALAGLLVAASLQAGCSTFGDGCGCGFGSRLKSCRIFNGTGFRLFHRGNACEPGCLGGDACTPGVIGGGMVMPMPGPGTVIGAPIGEEQDLAPAQMSPGSVITPAPPPSASSAPKTGAQASRSAAGGRFASPATRTPPAIVANITPEPAERPAAGMIASSTSTRGKSTGLPAPSDDPLDQMPPIKPQVEPSSPARLAESTASAPKIATDDSVNPSKKTSASDASNPPSSSPEGDSVPPSRPVSTVEANPTRAPDAIQRPAGESTARDSSAPVADGTKNMFPGIQSFAQLAPRVAAGSLPTEKGLMWLTEKGFKTVVDLRDSKDERQLTSASATSCGLRYLDIPVSATNLDPTAIKRALDEVTTEDNQPVYVFDSDGRRPAALWYAKLITVDKYSRERAVKAVADVGPIDPLYLTAVHHYIDPIIQSTPEAPSTAAPAPPATSAPRDGGPGAQAPRVVASAEDSSTPTPTPSPTSVHWSSYAALVVTLFGVPLGLVGNSAVRVRRRRASLPAPPK